MQISHRISYNANSEVHRQFLQIGLQPVEGGILNTLFVSESDERWEIVREKIRDFQLVDIVETSFDDSELNEAHWLVLQSAARGGFPMPDKNRGYLQESFDTSRANIESGIGAVQTSPILLKGLPKVAKSDIFQVFWLEEVFFAKLSVWTNILAPFGVKSISVLDWRTRDELQGICQMVPTTSSRAQVETEGLDQEVFGSQIRYSPPKGGFFPRLLTPPEGELNCFLTNEYFGSGASAYRYVIFSNRLYRELRDAKITGCGWIPLSA